GTRSVSTGGTCVASSSGGAAAAGVGPAVEADVSTPPPMTPAAIPAAPPASDRKRGRRMGFLLIGIGIHGTEPTHTRLRRLCDRSVKLGVRQAARKGKRAAWHSQT